MRKSTKKSTPNRSSSPARTNNKYEYAELSKVSLVSADPCHIYGVIVDANFPYKVNSERYIISLKIIDPTLNQKTKNEYATVVIYAQRFEDLPIVHRLGDIIRIHRANLRLYNGKRQFNVNMTYNSSWALYSSDKTSPLGEPSNELPYAHSGNKPTVERQDQAILSALKKYANGYFATQNVVDDKNVTALSKASKASGDFDVVAKVL